MYIKIPDNSNIIPSLQMQDKLRIVDWLIDNTILTEKQISDLCDIDEYTIHRLFNDEIKQPFTQLNPIEKKYIHKELLDFLQNAKILDAPGNEFIQRPLAFTDEYELAYSEIFSVKLIKAYFLSQGHNAWWGTWSSRYTNNKSIHLTLQSAKKQAERTRVQGRVFTISEIPTLCFYTKEKLIFVSGINDNESMPFQHIHRDFLSIPFFAERLRWENDNARYPQFIFSSINKMLYLNEIDEKEEFNRYTSESIGTNYFLNFYPRENKINIKFLKKIYLTLIDILKKGTPFDETLFQ